MNGVTVPTNIREYQEKLNAWERKVARWLGLPLDRVIRGGITATGPDGLPDKLGRPARIDFELTGDTHPDPPTRCWAAEYTVSVIGDHAGSAMIWRNAVILTNAEANAFHDEIGPRPQMFTPEEEDRLRALEAARADLLWSPGRWWRVLAPDGSLWCETSDEEEARERTRPGDRLQRIYERHETEWRDA